jgi:hypothetical protein
MRSEPPRAGLARTGDFALDRTRARAVGSRWHAPV